MELSNKKFEPITVTAVINLSENLEKKTFTNKKCI